MNGPTAITLDSIWFAMCHGWEMIVFYLLLAAFGLFFIQQIRNPASRWWVVRVLTSLTGLVGLLAPAHFALRQLSFHRILSISGQADPAQWAAHQQSAALGTILIASAAALLVLLTLWMSLLPRPPKPGSEPPHVGS